MRKILQSLFVLLFIASSSMAQDRTITGKVTSKDDGLGIPSVSIKLKGTSIGAQTANNGNYAIKVPAGNAVLVFSYIGYATQEITISNNTTVNVVMNADANQLNEVLVVAYGTINKSVFTGSTAQVNSEQFDKRPITNVLNAVAGIAPGIQATSASGAPGSTPGIRIRGFGSISATSDALYVVDGSVYDGDISNIDPDDVESVALLKDAATTALYGSRAGNGVVMITTKKGKAGKETLQFKASNGWVSRGLAEYDRADAQQYYPLMWEAYRNTLQYGSSKVPRDIANSIASGLTTSYNGSKYSGIKSLLGYNPFNVPDDQIVSVDGKLNPNATLLYGDDLDWADQAAQGGKKRQNYSMSYSGASDNSNYYSSLAYTNEQGYLIASGLKRYNGRINVNTKPLKWFETGLNLTGTYTKSRPDNVTGNTLFINPFFISRMIGPIYPVHLHDPVTGATILDANGEPQYDFGAGRPYSSGRHAIYENLHDTQNLVRGVISARTYATVNILPGLKATANLSFDLQDEHEREYDNLVIGDGAPSGRAYHNFYRTTSYTLSQILEYSKKFDKHNFSILAAHENYAFKYNTLTSSRTGQIVSGITELVNFSTVSGTSSLEDNATVESYFSRLNYDFDGKYLVGASLRRDGNSKFSSVVLWQNFWSVSAGWNINRESFFHADWVDQLKLRASYGALGNAEGLGYYPWMPLYALGRNNQSEPGAVQFALGEPSLTWETSQNFDAGLDFSLLKGRLSGAAEFFHRTTGALIFDVAQPLANGGTTGGEGHFEVATNIGSLYNRGVELQLTGQIVKSKNFTYSASLNLTHLTNKLTKMPEGQPLLQISNFAYSEGHSVFDYYLREFYGVDSQTGEALYKTNKTTSNTRIIGPDTVTTVIGEADYRYTGDSSIPDIYGAMSHNFGYKNFTLGVQFTFQTGGKVYDSGYAALMHGGSYGTAMHIDAANAWKNPGDVTDIPRLDNGRVTDFGGASSRFLTNASYFQLNNVTLSYNLPKAWMESIKAQRASIYLTADNLAIASARKGMGVSGSFDGSVGNNYNFSRTVSLGVSVNF